MVTKIQAQTLTAGNMLRSTTQKVADFAKRNKWLLLTAAVILTSTYLLWTFSVKLSAHHIPKGIVSKPFKWEELHPATTVQAVMDSFEAVKTNIDQQNLEQFVEQEFKGVYCAGKNTSALTLYLMLKPERIKLLSGFSASYAILALSHYIQHAEQGKDEVVNLMHSSSPKQLHICALALHKQNKLIDVYKANTSLRDSIIQAIGHKTFAAVYAKLEPQEKIEAHSRLVTRFLTTSPYRYLNINTLLKKNADIKDGFKAPLDLAMQNLGTNELSASATKAQSLQSFYITTFEEVEAEIKNEEFKPLHWALAAPKCSSEKLYKLYTDLPEDQKPRFYACLTANQKHELYKKINFIQAHLANAASTAYGFAKFIGNSIARPLFY